MMQSSRVFAVLFGLLATVAAGRAPAAEKRLVLSLGGTWQIAEGSMGRMPDRFNHRVPVPGLVDMAEPAFEAVGEPSSNGHREAFWYRRTFRIEGPVPAVAELKIFKAKYGSRVLLNGKLVGDHLPCFTPALFDVREHLRASGQTNELVIRVGAGRKSVPRSIPDGWDFEKMRYIPGIYDSVQLILSGTPHLLRVQTVPDLQHQTVRVVALVANSGEPADNVVKFRVREAATGRLVGSVTTDPIRVDSGQQKQVDVEIPIENCRLWSPATPFLYRLETSTGADTLSVRFGMRSFRLDPKTKQAFLNGKPYPLRGTNVCIFRFFEDASRGDLPWREEWVRRLHRLFRGMHWEAIRYCIGFPPEKWYDIADEEGLLIQDEFPIWYLMEGNRHGVWWPEELTSEELVREYTDWIHERCNHPCVVIWDAQNETDSGGETAEAIARVRGLDLSGRPWDNGWEPPQSPDDSLESHPYIFSKLNWAKQMDANPITQLAKVMIPRAYGGLEQKVDNAVIVNEYGWLWLSRDGTPTTVTENVYRHLLGPDASVPELRRTYARYLAAMTEYWRSHRQAAGVLHFCSLTYSRPGTGQTSDHFLNLEELSLELNFEELVRDAFSPVGLMVDLWDLTLPPGENRKIDVPVINDLQKAWEGKVRLKLVRDGDCLWEEVQSARVDAVGRKVLSFTMTTPDKPGDYQLVAELIGFGNRPVHSLRDFSVSAE